MDFEKIQRMTKQLMDILAEYGDDEVEPAYNILKSTYRRLTENLGEAEKERIIIECYNMIYPGNHGLSEFYIWDNDFEERKRLNEPLNEIHDYLWSVVSNYKQ